MAELIDILKTSLDYLRPVLEVGLLVILIYNCLYFLRGTRGSHILAGIIIALIFFTTLSDYFKFEVLSLLLSNLWAIIPIFIIVIFQPELRRAFAQLGTTPFVSRRLRKQEALNEVVNSIITMSKQHTGALIIFERQIGMRAIINNAVRLDAKLTRHLLESIFYPNSPLHDGAAIVKDDRIIAAHAILPLSQDESLVRTLGTRHRAAIGITEETDAVAVIVSEETGKVSIACRGSIRRDVKHNKLMRFLSALLISRENDTNLQDLFSSLQDTTEITNGFKDNTSK